MMRNGKVESREALIWTILALLAPKANVVSLVSLYGYLL
jgi:hypothetical protein